MVAGGNITVDIELRSTTSCVNISIVDNNFAEPVASIQLGVTSVNLSIDSRGTSTIIIEDDGKNHCCYYVAILCCCSFFVVIKS